MFLGKDGNGLKELINALVEDSGDLQTLTGPDEVKKALGSDLPSHYHDVYAKAFKEVFNKVRDYSPGNDLETDQKLKDSAKESIKNKIDNTVFSEAGLNDLSSDQKEEFKSACVNAYFSAYNTAVDVDGDLSEFKDESKIKTKLNEALGKSPKISLLSAVQVAAYAKAASASGNDAKQKEAGRRAVGAVAAAERAGNINCAEPADVPFVDAASKNAGYAMTFGIFWNNLFSVYFLYLMDAHL
ncbi:uncharacterized protein BdWA1_003506, partial [Babesia duncani]